MNQQIKQDVFDIANSVFNYGFNGDSILVTGATGMIGATIIKGILESNRIYHTNIVVIAAVRNKEKLLNVLGKYSSDKNLFILVGDITDKIDYDGQVDYIIHTASITASKAMVETPVEVIKTSVLGTIAVLDFAIEHKVKSLVYLSSLEVYGIMQEKKGGIFEQDLGYIDILNVRSSYSEGKRMAENICVSYSKEYDLNVKIARLAQIVGADVSVNDNRLFVQLAKSVVEKNDIVLHTTGETARNYCYVTDAIDAILLLLTKGENGVAYNVANEQTYMSVRNLAEYICLEVAKGSIKLVYDIPKDVSKFGYFPTSKVNMNCSKLIKLGWKPKVDLMDMILRLTESMKNHSN